MLGFYKQTGNVNVDVVCVLCVCLWGLGGMELWIGSNIMIFVLCILLFLAQHVYFIFLILLVVIYVLLS